MQFAVATPEQSNSFLGTLAYDFQPFALLDQQTDGAFVDLLGRITQVDASEMYAKLSKVLITIASADYFEQIECLGAHALLGFQENQTLACKGVQVKTYKGNRC